MSSPCLPERRVAAPNARKNIVPTDSATPRCAPSTAPNVVPDRRATRIGTWHGQLGTARPVHAQARGVIGRGTGASLDAFTAVSLLAAEAAAY
jgi:hypothetical protein